MARLAEVVHDNTWVGIEIFPLLRVHQADPSDDCKSEKLAGKEKLRMLPLCSCMYALSNGGAVANRLRRRTSDQTVLGSNPAVAAAN